MPRLHPKSSACGSTLGPDGRPPVRSEAEPLVAHLPTARSGVHDTRARARDHGSVNPWWLLASLGILLLARFALRGRTLDATPLLFLRLPFNAIAFAARRALRLRRGRPDHPNEPKDDLFDFAEDRAAVEARERELRARYALAPLHARSSRHVYRENLYVLDALDTLVGDRAAALPAALRALDVGSQDFRYAFALERWLSRAATTTPRAVSLTGIEIDGHPIYADRHTRADHAEAFAAETGNPEVRYRVADFLACEVERAHVVTLFFPFVLSYALVRWGLPLRHFRPEPLLAKIADALEDGGLLVVVNHTHEEHAAQRLLLAALPSLEVVGSWPVPGRMVDYGDDVPERTLTLARRAHRAASALAPRPRTPGSEIEAPRSSPIAPRPGCS
jgi:SAM-dependent methyltransferase